MGSVIRTALVGERFGKLTVMRRWGQHGLFRCDCGNTVERRASHVVSGSSKCCGCSVIPHRRTHGKDGTPTHVSWKSMKARVKGQMPRCRHIYLGMDIQPEWAASFEAFLADMGERPPGTTLDRIDGTKGYVRGNCRWADAPTQGANRKTVIFVEYGGETMPLKTAAKAAALPYSVVHTRYARGVRGDALFLPSRGRGTRVTEDTVRKIREMHSAGTPQSRIASVFDLSGGAVCNIVHRKSWSNVA